MSTSERAPLLAPSPDSPTASIAISTLLSSLAALRAQKLPSNAQLAQISTALLNSSLLSLGGTIWHSEYGSGRIGTGRLSREGENVRIALRGVLEASGEWVKQRNQGEVLQELVTGVRESEIEMKRGAKQQSIPVSTATNELKELLLLFMTAPEMRSLFFDLVDLLKGTMSEVVEGTGPLESTVNSVLGGKGKGVEDLDQAKDDFVDRFVKILLMIQSTPSYQSSIRLLIAFVKSSIPSPSSIPLPTLSSSSPLSHLSHLVENHTGGPDSLRPLEESYRNLVEASVGEESLVGLLGRVDAMLERVLVDAGCINTSSFRRELDKAYNDFAAIRSSTTLLGQSLRSFLSHLSTILQSIATDQILTTLLERIGKLVLATEMWVLEAGKIASGRDRIWGDVVEVILPRLLSIVKELPLPRIEFSSSNLDIAIEAPTFLSTSFIPDHIQIDTLSSLSYTPSFITPAFSQPHAVHSHHLAAQRTKDETKTDFESRSTVRIAGLRMQIEQLGYWIHYKGPCGLGFVDSGLLSIGIGRMLPIQEGGIEAVVTVSTPSCSEDEEADSDSLFDIESVAISLKSFSLSLSNTSHPLLSSLLLSTNPATQTIIQAQIESLLSTYLTEGLESVSRFGEKVARRIKGGMGAGRAVWETLLEEEEEVEEVVEEDDEVEIRLTKKGLLIELDEESSIGIGRSTVVLPSSIPTSTPLPRPTINEIVSEQYSDTIQNTKEVVLDVGEGVEAAVEGVRGFEETVRKEMGKDGWRSEAFDF